jgi:uncharacterized protein (DUF983 family)
LSAARRPVNPVTAGLACRCPACGEGSLFEGFLRVSRRCESCGLDLAAADSGDGPAVFIVLIVGVITCFSALFTEIAFHPPVWMHLLLWVPLAAILALLLVRPLKGLMLAIQFHHRAAESAHDDD